MSLDAFSEYFGALKAPRQTAKISYPLFDVLFLTVCAVIAGAEGWEDIEDFGEAHLDWFQDKGCFPMACRYMTPLLALSLLLTRPSSSNALFIGRNQSISAQAMS